MLREKRVKTTTSVYSDVGKVRKANEDSYYVSRDENLLIVCDGMGGQVAGGLASKMAVETIKDVYQNLSDKQVQEFLYEQEKELAISSQRLVAAVRLANRRIYNISTQFPKLRGMGTTVVALSLDKSFATMVHVGDSRIFRHSEDKIWQLTEDHSWLNELIEDKEINEEQIETFAQKNVITRALGTGPHIKIDIHCEKYKTDDIYVLCTDGMHGSVGPNDIKKIIDRSNGSVEKVTRRLIEKAIRRDGSDNVTVAVARLDQDSQETKVAAVSTTIPEEGTRITQKEDKFIHENYTEPQLQGSKIPMTNAMNSRPVLTPVILVLTALVCFMLGMFLTGSSSKSPTPSAKSQPLVSLGAKQAASLGRSKEAITRSRIGDDAVLAVVFFNSGSDYNQAQLEERGLVLEKILPYANDGGPSIDEEFSIFLIDGNSNVIRRTSTMQLPKPER